MGHERNQKSLMRGGGVGGLKRWRVVSPSSDLEVCLPRPPPFSSLCLQYWKRTLSAAWVSLETPMGPVRLKIVEEIDQIRDLIRARGQMERSVGWRRMGLNWLASSSKRRHLFLAVKVSPAAQMPFP